MFFKAIKILFYFFFVSTTYITFKQRHLISQLGSLHEKVRKLNFQLQLEQKRKALKQESTTSTSSGNEPSSSPLTSEEELSSSSSLTTSFLALNRQLVYHCSEISGNNRFWRPHLSGQLVAVIVCVCYMSWVTIFQDASPDQLVFFAYFMCQMGSLLIGVMVQCSMLDTYNRRLYLLNTKTFILLETSLKMSSTLNMHVSYIFFKIYLKKRQLVKNRLIKAITKTFFTNVLYNCTFFLFLNIFKQLKNSFFCTNLICFLIYSFMFFQLHKLTTNRTLLKCCFSLRNGTRLDPGAFNLVIVIISSFFMKMLSSKKEEVL